MKSQRAKVFKSGGSQAVRLPKEFRFDTPTVLISRKGGKIILEAEKVDKNGWPIGWVESFRGMPTDFKRPPQGKARPLPKFDLK